MMHDWICSLAAASAVAALAKQLTPGGTVKKTVELLCGVMLLAVLASPVLTADMPTLALSMAEYRRTAAELTEDAQAAENQLLREYIEQQCAAYILREAHNLGIEEIQVTVRTKWRDENWVPYEFLGAGAVSAAAKEKLTAFLAAELGIPRERQSWDE